MSYATSPPESLRSTPTPDSECASSPPKSRSPTPTPEPVHTNSTPYYYISRGGRRVYPDTSSLTPYKPLPEGWDESEHYWFYGWPASNRKLQSLLVTYFNRPEACTTPCYDASLVMIILERLSSYSHLARLTCKASEEDKKAGIVERRSGGVGILFLTVSSTARQRFFMQRPTVEQLEFLSSIFGEPRWIETVYPKKGFCFELLE